MYPAVENPRISGYDRSATMFSPKGRLYQVEYASKIVEQGTLGVGIIFDKGILFAADKFVVSNLTVPESIEKLFKINKFNGAISAGLVGDARRLIEFARQKVTENMSTYEEDIETEVLVRDIASIKQVFTQYGGMRPFGVSLIIGGIQNHHPRLFETEDRKSTRLNSSHSSISYAFFFFNATATTEIYTLSLHDALPISIRRNASFWR